MASRLSFAVVGVVLLAMLQKSQCEIDNTVSKEKLLQQFGVDPYLVSVPDDKSGESVIKNMDLLRHNDRQNDIMTLRHRRSLQEGVEPRRAHGGSLGTTIPPQKKLPKAHSNMEKVTKNGKGNNGSKSGKGVVTGEGGGTGKGGKDGTMSISDNDNKGKGGNGGSMSMSDNDRKGKGGKGGSTSKGEGKGKGGKGGINTDDIGKATTGKGRQGDKSEKERLESDTIQLSAAAKESSGGHPSKSSMGILFRPLQALRSMNMSSETSDSIIIESRKAHGESSSATIHKRPKTSTSHSMEKLTKSSKSSSDTTVGGSTGKGSLAMKSFKSKTVKSHKGKGSSHESTPGSMKDAAPSLPPSQKSLKKFSTKSKSGKGQYLWDETSSVPTTEAPTESPTNTIVPPVSGSILDGASDPPSMIPTEEPK